MRIFRHHIPLLSLLLLIAGCELFGPIDPTEAPRIEVPFGFQPVPIPAYNSLTKEKIELGEKLFFDPILSGDQSIACSHCHDPASAFTDGVEKSIGINERTGVRNAPSLLNVAYQQLLFWDGGSLNLEAQVLAPLENKDEMDADVGIVIQRLIDHPTYPALFKEAFGAAPSIRTLTQAVAAYERTLVSSGSRYDQYLQGDTLALSPEEQSGLELFQGKAACATCHSGFLLTNLAFENKGLAIMQADSGRARITLDPSDYGRFKVPSLRNVAITAPYMHDGRLPTLTGVIQHYNRGGDNVRGQSPHVKPLGLSDDEMRSLEAFLNSLTDE